METQNSRVGFGVRWESVKIEVTIAILNTLK